jgi:uncharacterized protein YdeI (YjbR/CyaY-like superfamily)
MKSPAKKAPAKKAPAKKTAAKKVAVEEATPRPGDLPMIRFEGPDAFTAWLDEHHASSPGIWLQLAKKASGTKSVTYAEAVEVALCHGWIDGQKQSHDDASWLQKFTRRGPKSLWSKINRQKVEDLVASGRMRPQGLAEVLRAKKDGRWDQAYDSPKAATVPDDLKAALEKNAKAKASFAALNGANRYAILFRVQTAKKAETRARRIEELVAMLARGEKLHP